MDDEINISGVLVHTRPGDLHQVRQCLNALPGVEVHATDDSGHLVVTIENTSVSMVDTMNEFHNIKGVLSASLIYHHFENSEDAIGESP